MDFVAFAMLFNVVYASILCYRPPAHTYTHVLTTCTNTHMHTHMHTHTHTHTQVPVGHPDEVEEIFDLISYSKGASVIRMLYDWIGDEVRSILEYAGVYNVLLECASVLQSITRYASTRVYICR